MLYCHYVCELVVSTLKHVLRNVSTDDFLNSSLFSTKIFDGNRLINIVHCYMFMYTMQNANYVLKKNSQKSHFLDQDT